MDRLETRELVYFVAVAEELHFGRAADRLGIAQPPLSRAIGRLERRLGVVLFERSSRRVALTEPGEVLLSEGRKALEAVTAAERRTRRAGRRVPRLALALKPGSDGGLLPEILAAYEARADAVPVDVVMCGMHERTAVLRDGRADVGLLHGSLADLHGLDTAELLVESQIAVLPRRHRLAGRTSLTLADLKDETLPRWQADRDERPAARDVGELMQLIALGRLVAVVPSSVRGQIRADLAHVPVEDAPHTPMVLAWPRHRRSQALAGFVHTASTVAARVLRD
ncbi:LysR family transcriptional regulator [Actinomadura sp. NEAU-AAG7]|uniref:LysR family transcriptional regulator n=1 Tax=Actinomadura sp. NEAU-AAG7 TaxID=2839640 RepID=UPI001BE3D7D2|nr:LysR family transcriptional regulator [Actinomadura sp. NEAU-AAG7]MBT2208936.1 LysR family transcriptional regulator [Actinomadura sp. NEAU-AAG7]